MSVMKEIAYENNLYAQQSAITPSCTGASSTPENEWHSINWRKVNQEVRRLQARIVKATQEKRWGKVKALQRLLTRSFSGRALAVRRVTENKGKWTPGIDREIWDTPHKKAEAIKRLRQHGYKAQPLRRVYIDKSNGKGKRPLGIPCMIDRAFQTLYKMSLDPIAETTGDPNSYGFRLGRSTADAIEQTMRILCRKDAATWVLEADIRACFDTINHQWLLDHIPIEKRMLSQWLRAGVMEGQTLVSTTKGAPQGSPISPVLANMTLDGLERLLKKRFRKSPPKPNPKVHVVRFADDFIISGDSRERLEEEVLPILDKFLAERGLERSEEKTRITHIEQGFDFLGQHIRKYKGKFRIKPSNKSVTSLLTKLRTLIKANKQATAGQLITQLNPIITGWANYHRHVYSRQTFGKIDHEVFKALWQWAKRRHRNKLGSWVARKYFRLKPHWQFHGFHPDQKGITTITYLASAGRIRFERHIKIRMFANPYDPQWEQYFEKRIHRKMSKRLRGAVVLRSLWRSQNGVCPVCLQKITEDTGWERHHLVWRTHGGGDSLDNLVLLHPTCHTQVHHQQLTVVKPRPSSGV